MVGTQVRVICLIEPGYMISDEGEKLPCPGCKNVDGVAYVGYYRDDGFVKVDECPHCHRKLGGNEE